MQTRSHRECTRLEKLIRINRVEAKKRGRADAYYGNVIIEIEKSLSATLGEAEEEIVRICGRDGSTGQRRSTSGPPLLRLTA